jgi:cytochrome P450
MMWSGLDVPVNITEWAMAELVRHPEIQRKVQQEIDDVVGSERAVRESDIPHLPYLTCVVKEVFRVHPAGPFGVPRMNMVPAKAAAYDIPAFTYVMISNTELGVSSSIWPRGDAEQFRPERWEVNDAEQLQIQDPELRINPFGLGRRSCAGAELGSTLVLLCVATLVQSFHWGPGHGQNREDIDMRPAFQGLMPMQTPLIALATPRSRSWEID